MSYKNKINIIRNMFIVSNKKKLHTPQIKFIFLFKS